MSKAALKASFSLIPIGVLVLHLSRSAFMPKLIKNGQVVEDNWVVMPKPDDVENASVIGENVIVPMALWLAQADRLSQRSDLGIWIDSDEESTRLNSSHVKISYAVFCLKKKRV